MTKNEVITFHALILYALGRAERSAKRNDPWAWAYWRQTADWANTRKRLMPAVKTDTLLSWIGLYQTAAEEAAVRGKYVDAATLYSRAKWFAIILRNLKVRIPKKAGCSLKWLRKIEADALEPVA